MKNILIISYLFAPRNAIGAVRPTKFAKYLTKLGYKVDVVCACDNNAVNGAENDDIANISCINRIQHSDKYKELILKVNSHVSNNVEKSPKQKQENKKSILKIKLMKYKSKLVRFLISFYGDIDFYLQVKKYINSNRIKLEDYDVMFSTFGPVANHYIAKYIKKKNNNIKWVADFRDNMYGEHVPLGFKTYIKYMQYLFCKKADHITAISKGCLEEIIKLKFVNKSSVITNGYDKDDFRNLEGSPKKTSKFILTYTGATYEGKRDLSVIFRIISELDNENKIDKNNIQFYYAGNEGKYVIEQAERYNCEDIVIDFGYVSRQKSLELQNQSQFLVVSTWNERNNKGILSGKFFEYMLSGKPIIATVTGDVKNSEISEIISDCKLGYCYEKIRHSECYEGLKDYILEQYMHFINSGEIFFEPSLEKRDRYNYIMLTAQLANIFEK